MKIQNEYITISKKRELANKVVLMSSYNVDGLIKIDSFKRKVYTFMLAAEGYLDENFGEDFDAMMDKYDELIQSDVGKQIMTLNDYADFEWFVFNAARDAENMNSIECSVAKMCQAVVDAVNNISDALSDKISEFDTDILNDTNIMELMSVINKFK